MSVAVGDFGNALVIGAGFDLGGRQVTMTAVRPDGSSFSGSCTVGTAEVNLPLETFLPGQYAIYTILSGDLNQNGIYNVQLFVKPPVAGYLGQSQFRVGNP